MPKAERLKEKIETLKKQMQKLKDIEAQLHESPDQQISLTHPDARSMATSGRGTGTIGYNVQTAVDDNIDHAYWIFLGYVIVQTLRQQVTCVRASPSINRFMIAPATISTIRRLDNCGSLHTAWVDCSRSADR
jgi:hypothetical protein